MSSVDAGYECLEAGQEPELCTNRLKALLQRLTPGAIRILRLERHADTSKARRELGFVPTPHEDAVREAYEFFVARGEIAGDRKRAAG